jgi:hypothetical protein
MIELGYPYLQYWYQVDGAEDVVACVGLRQEEGQIEIRTLNQKINVSSIDKILLSLIDKVSTFTDRQNTYFHWPTKYLLSLIDKISTFINQQNFYFHWSTKLTDVRCPEEEKFKNSKSDKI